MGYAARVAEVDISSGSLKGRDQVDTEEDSILDSATSDQRQVAGSCEHGTEPAQ
jgi:hypothetical protein